MIEGQVMTLLFVSDVDRAVAWYRDVLGMALRARHGDFATLEAGGAVLGLHGGAPAGGAPREGGTMPVLRVAEYAAAKADLEARGCAFTFENQTPAARFGTFHDPDGNPLQIYGPAGS